MSQPVVSSLAHRHAALIGAAIGIGAGDPRTAFGPAQLHKAGVLTKLEAAGASAHWVKTLLPMLVNPRQDLYDRVAEFSGRLAQTVASVMARRQLPVVLGGDHSCAVGTWSGVAQALRSTDAHPAEFGLLWIDAHKDAHTPQTTPSGHIHGMPLAALLGHGDARLTTLGGPAPKLLPQHVCLIGARSFEPGEASLLNTLGVRVYYMDEIAQRGLAVVMAEALERVRAARDGFGVSFDLDAIDPRDAPGTGCPEAEGIRAVDALAALRQLAGDPALLALEVVEYNPLLDRGGRTAALVVQLLEAVLMDAAGAAERGIVSA